MAKHSSGLTVVEVIVALAILAIVVAVLATMTVSSLRHDYNSASRTQAVQVLNYLGRLASDNSRHLLGGDRAWDYGELSGTFSELATEAGRANPNLYRAEVEGAGVVIVGLAQTDVYRVNVCWIAGSDEHCVSGTTAALPIATGESEPIDPVVN